MVHQGGCGYVEWHDDPLPKFLSDLIGDLRDEVRRLRGESSVAVFEDYSAVVALPEAQRGREVLALEDQLKEKNAELDALKGKYQNVVFLHYSFQLALTEIFALLCALTMKSNTLLINSKNCRLTEIIHNRWSI